MAFISKRVRHNHEKCPDHKVWTFDAAITQLKSLSQLKFVESCDVAVCLGVVASKSDQVVRGATNLPHGTGRSVRVAVLAQGAAADAARQAGADLVGFEDLAEDIKQQAEKGNWDFDILIATPEAMRLVGLLGRLLGPRGLMPNPKLGTVTTDTALAVKNAKAGRKSFRTDKAGIIHASIGKLSFEGQALRENCIALLLELRRLRPSTAKGQYFKKLVLSSTMGPGLIIDLSFIQESIGS
jgi:large subunit ribosomal protein L1